MRLIRQFGRDWLRAPISGTAQVAALVGAVAAAWYGDHHGVLLWLILCHVIGIQRGPMTQEEK